MGYGILGISLALFLGILVCLELGRRLGLRARKHGLPKGIGHLEAGVFGLLGLMVAFTFGGAAGRWETRRTLIVQEANDIGTAYLRLDLLRAEDRAQLQDLFKQYVASRLEVYRVLPDEAAAMKELQHANQLQSAIWSNAVRACEARGDDVSARLLLPALNDMIDITTTRTMAARAHPPLLIFLLLYFLALAGSLIAGHGMAADSRRNWLHQIGYALIMSASIYVILEDRIPTRGLHPAFQP